ncbi:MAG: hypothetical protein ABSF80_04910 [Chitinispirillaceae bacterium]|jgi:hypothetical protein
MHETNEYLDQTIQLSKQLLYCAEFGDHEREDESCGDFYRIVRESADKILTAAEQERLYHLDRETGKPEKTNRIIARKVAAVRAFCKMYLS